MQIEPTIKRESLLSVIQRLEKDNSFALLYHYGAIGFKVWRDKEIFLNYDMLLKTRNGMTNCKAESETAAIFNVSERSVRRAIQFMTQS